MQRRLKGGRVLYAHLSDVALALKLNHDMQAPPDRRPETRETISVGKLKRRRQSMAAAVQQSSRLAKNYNGSTSNRKSSVGQG